MATRRICPKCRKQYPDDEIVCEECGERLADISSDFEASFSMVRDPVLLSNGNDVEVSYLQDELKRRNVPYYVEEGENAVPTDNFMQGTVKMVLFTNFYVDKSRWKTAKEALLCAKEESRKDQESPAVFFDMPKEAPEDEPEKGAGKSRGKGEEGPEDGDAGKRSLWAGFMDQEIYVKLGIVVIAAVFLLGLAGVILS